MALVNYQSKNTLGIMRAVGDLIRLLPGVNHIDDKIFDEIKKNKLFKERVLRTGLGSITIISDTVDTDGKHSIDDMIKNIPNILDVKLLRKIIETDGRQKVVKLAQNQLDKVKVSTKTKTEPVEENEHFS